MKLEINFLPAHTAAERMKAKLSMIRAKGTTPIARSLEEGAKDFPSGDARNIVILITDGKEECGMDPCAVSRLYQRKGIILKPLPSPHTSDTGLAAPMHNKGVL